MYRVTITILIGKFLGLQSIRVPYALTLLGRIIKSKWRPSYHRDSSGHQNRNEIHWNNEDYTIITFHFSEKVHQKMPRGDEANNAGRGS